ncbi:hypothetical protein Sjap_002341 [Stephania japonica]|uniref:Uncharacterized protein n=1 Tax=Stephania japonica TaxID=461633 RepID=A0AAP0KLX2_9MAGN
MGWLNGISHRIVENPELRINLDTKEDDDIYDVRQVVDAMTTWKSLPPGKVANIDVVKMADEVLKHLLMSNSGGLSETTSSAATQS